MSHETDTRAPFALTRIFAFVSLVAVLATAAALAILYRELSIRTIVEFGEQSNVIVARTALNAVLPELEGYLEDEASATAGAAAHVALPGLLNPLRASVRDTLVKRIKIYNRDGVILYSSREHEVGTDDSANPRFLGSIQGQVRSELRYRDVFNLFDHSSGDDNLIETYVPIWQPGKRQPVGVFEVYTDVGSIVRAMARNELLILAGIAAIMVLLYGLLLYVVHRLDGIISNQRQTILERNRILEVLSARMLAAEENERRRVAWELHEEIAQTLSAVKIKVETLANAAAQTQSPSVPLSVGEIVPLVQNAIRDVRALAMDLRPPALDDFGLIDTTRWLCREAEQVHGQLEITSSFAVREAEIPDPLKSVIFRVVQQTLKRLVGAPGISDIHLALKKDEGLRLILGFNAGACDTGDSGEPLSALEERPIADLWERTVLAGGSFSATRTDDGRCLYQAAWFI